MYLQRHQYFRCQLLYHNLGLIVATQNYDRPFLLFPYFKLNCATFGCSGFTINLFSLGCISTSISSIGIAPSSISVSPGNTMALQVAVRFSNCTSIGPTMSNSIGLPSASCAIRFSFVLRPSYDCVVSFYLHSTQY